LIEAFGSVLGEQHRDGATHERAEARRDHDGILRSVAIKVSKAEHLAEAALGILVLEARRGARDRGRATDLDVTVIDALM